LIPYVACMLVGTGMFSHFWIVLMRFLRHRDKAERRRWALFGAGLLTGQFLFLSRSKPQRDRALRKKRGKTDTPPPSPAKAVEPDRNVTTVADLAGNVGLVLLLLVLAGWLATTFGSPRESNEEMKVHEFGKLPIIADGRVKPLDTLARNSLRILSSRETFQDESGKRQPAIRWLLDTIADPEAAEKHRVVRIVNLEVLDLLDLERRKSHLYAIEEIRPRILEFEKEVIKAREKDVEQLSTYERKLIELDQRIRTYTRVGAAFQPPGLPPLPTNDDDRESSETKVRAFRDAYTRFVRGMDSVRPALAVPLQNTDGEVSEPEWQSYARAWADASIGARLTGQEPPPAVRYFETMLVAYHDQDVRPFNRAVEDYQRFLEKEAPTQLVAKSGMVGDFVKQSYGSFYALEAYFNHVAPFYHCSVLYLFAFLLAALAWLGWSAPLNRAAFLLITVTLVVHSLALLARVYISGRPPVTNLYSSAVFIGWGVVVFGLVFEILYRNGIGNVIAAVLGFGSLVVAHNLADGDTFTVLQAVLDTQFWLATHVVTVALGYATTFVAGGLGVVYVLRGFMTPTLDKTTRRELTRMIYGTVCFSIFFSFVGTVLGGLWADDSWGRFWGWDPKENGALIIVLWNALVLHAYWGRIVKERGLAVLAVGGNMVTSWSWFGVNELGVGLHSYGFTEGALRNLGLFNASQMGILILGMLPLSWWWSYRVRDAEEPIEKPFGI
ncbi:MAG: cytochrome c biogenesis protein, partial [Pirellulaceae bacterium]